MTSIFVLSDDLSGAAETAAAFRLHPSRSYRPTVRLHNSDRLIDRSPDSLIVLDTDTRYARPSDAGTVVREVIPASAGIVFKKTDSLLRGNVAAELGAIAGSRTVVFCPALPALGRSLMDGVLHIEGRPLSDTDLWDAEPFPVPNAVADIFAGSATAVVSLGLLRGDRDSLLAMLTGVEPGGLILLCDSETQADIAALVDAALEAGLRAFAGSSAVATALADRLAEREPVWAAPEPQVRASGTSNPGLLLVVGTASRVARDQVARLAERGIPVVELAPVELLGGPEGEATATDRLAGRVADILVVTLAPLDPDATPDAAALVAALARVIAPIVTDRDLILTGGETARRILDELGIDTLWPIDQVEHGAVRSVAADGRSIVTRPGSFGTIDSLSAVVDHLRPSAVSHYPLASPENPEKGTHMSTSNIAVTMGDGAGVGPEIVVAALLDPEIVAGAHSVVIGDAGRLRQAAEILGLDADIRVVAGFADADFTQGIINVIDLGLLPADLPWGALSAVAGDAAYQYIKVACELANAGEVQAICTAPLNKEALHLGGHSYPGHTELLAELTGTPEVSMMLTTPQLTVIHVTTHIGLVDAIAKINPALVERTIRRGYDALVRAGNPNPKIGVCAINPHAGENGLFGYGEEEEKIAPGVRAARADGIDVYGPLPADTLFFLAGRGDFDLVVAMYHDQGHGPVKVLGIDVGVNITVGLPVIRTSVDHGTAFDIAGTGRVDTRSMVEAMRQAIEVAPKAVV